LDLKTHCSFRFAAGLVAQMLYNAMLISATRNERPLKSEIEGSPTHCHTPERRSTAG
jgi:hypothetical protein